MKFSLVAQRYAKALYELAVESNNQDKVFSDLRALELIFDREKEVHGFLTNPLVGAKERTEVLGAAINGKGLAKETHDLLLLLAQRDRLAAFKEIVAAYEQQADAANKVCRGTVRSAAVLGQEDRQRVEATVEKVLNKKVIMTYKVDPTVIGGLIAQVGSYTFDDTIASHLRRMDEELKRRTV